MKVGDRVYSTAHPERLGTIQRVMRQRGEQVLWVRFDDQPQYVMRRRPETVGLVPTADSVESVPATETGEERVLQAQVTLESTLRQRVTRRALRATLAEQLRYAGDLVETDDAYYADEARRHCDLAADLFEALGNDLADEANPAPRCRLCGEECAPEEVSQCGACEREAEEQAVLDGRL